MVSQYMTPKVKSCFPGPTVVFEERDHCSVLRYLGFLLTATKDRKENNNTI